MKFCVKCGKDISKGIFCEECGQESKALVDINMQICGCGRYFSRNMWLPCKDEIDAVQKLVKDKYGGKISNLQFDGKKTYEADIAGKRIFVSIASNKCALCSRKGSYFEGVLQIRCKSQQNLDACLKMIEKELKAVDKKGIFINKIEEQKDGADLYMTSQKYIQELARKISERFGGTIKINPTLFSRNKQTSKQIYRVNAYVELPDFTAGDAVKVHDIPARIVKVGKRILCRDLKNDKQIILVYGKDNYTILRKYETTISRVAPHAEAINPIDFQSEEVKNPKDEKINEKVVVVVDNGLYIIRKD